MINLTEKSASEPDNSTKTFDITSLSPSVALDVTHTYNLENISFDNLPPEIVNSIMKDGRVFSHFIEKWLEKKYPIIHIPGCKDHDFIDINNSEIKYDEKTFTESSGCNFCPSNMLGQGRIFDQEIFQEKAKKLVYCIVSNIHFPLIKVKFARGLDLIAKYPKGKIPLKDHIKFFN